MTILSDAIMLAIAADDAYSAAVEKAGYKSRWDVPLVAKEGEVRAAYLAKIEADKLCHDLWEQSRRA